MLYTIENNCLSVQINSKGGEIQSIKSKNGTEYLWQGDNRYWSDRAPNLFPYIARLTDGKYLFEGKEYHMDIHGFLKDYEMQLEEIKGEKLVLYMESNPESFKQYPFCFRFVLTYELIQNRLEITYCVENKQNTNMYFAVGGHPGFIVPIEETLEFQDYFLEFTEECKPERIEFSEDCFVTGKRADFELENKKILLSHDIFDSDAIVLVNAHNEIVLKSEKDSKSVTVGFPQMKYLGIWHWPQSEVPYVCIEPWSSLPSRENIIEDLSEQENLICLTGGNTYSNKWWIEIK